jgi:RNA polymerase sigma-70 factor (ECF subfamily)
MQDSIDSTIHTGAGDAQGTADSLRLAAAIAAGDRDAESLFVQYYWPRVGVMLLARSRDRDLTADLRQTTMLEALCALRRGQLRDPAKLSAFVIGIARNLLNKHLQGLGRTAQWDEATEVPAPMVSGNSLEELERRKIAERAIGLLRPVDRSILRMTLVDGLKPGAVADRLQMNDAVVRQRKLRATRRVIEFVRRLSQKPGSNHLTYRMELL